MPATPTSTDGATLSPVEVLYIGGAGRSGSTLLERRLSQGHDCVCVGELRWIWDRGLRQNQLCSCGSPFHDCSFWQEIFAEAFGGMDTPEVDGVLSRQQRLDRFRYVPPLMVRRLRSRAFQARLDAHGATLTDLYAAIARISGRTVVVDSSKSATYAYILAALPTVELKLLHLVRDSRGVAFSWSRKRQRPEAHDHVQYMPRFSPRRAAMIWLKVNLLLSLLRRRLRRETLLRYEDYTIDGKLVDRACSILGVAPPEDRSVATGGRSLPTWHSMSGNPLRFEPQESTIRVDEEWREGLSTAGLLTVTLLTAPMLTRYGYRLRRHGGVRPRGGVDRVFPSNEFRF